MQSEGRQGIVDNGQGIKAPDHDMPGDFFGYRLIHVLKGQLDTELTIKAKEGTHVELVTSKYKKTV